MSKPPVDNRRYPSRLEVLAGNKRWRRATFVYRIYDADGVLLYVGSSVTPYLRVESHRGTWWGARIASVRYVVFPDTLKALDVERDAIYNERPVCNVKGRWYKYDPRSDWTLDDYRTYRHAVVQTSKGYIGGHTGRLLGHIDSEVRDRFGVSLIEKRSAS